MFIIDTNVFVYAANARCGEHAARRGLLKRSHSGQEVPAMRGNLLHDAHTAILMLEAVDPLATNPP